MTSDEIWTEFVRETIDKMLRKLPIQKRLEGLSAEQRLEGLSAEQRLEGVSTDQLQEELARRLKGNGTSPQPK